MCYVYKIAFILSHDHTLISFQNILLLLTTVLNRTNSLKKNLKYYNKERKRNKNSEGCKINNNKNKEDEIIKGSPIKEPLLYDKCLELIKLS